MGFEILVLVLRILVRGSRILVWGLRTLVCGLRVLVWRSRFTSVQGGLLVAGWSGGGGKEGIVKIVFLARYTCCSSATDHREGCQNMDSEQQPTEQLSVVPGILKCSIAFRFRSRWRAGREHAK